VAREGGHFLFAAISVKVKSRYFGSCMINVRLLQLGDSALPVGGYTHSWGLETAIARGLVSDAASLERWTRLWLRRSFGPLEGVVVAAVCGFAAAESWPQVLEANQLVTASLNPVTLRKASQEMGEQLLQLAATWEWSRRRVAELAARADGPDSQKLRTASADDGERATWHYCVAFGILGAFAKAGAEEALSVFLNQAVLGMIAAGVRGIPVGHTHAQQILAYLHSDIEELTQSLARQDLQTAGSGCPSYEVLCHEQPRLYTRLFRS
jgi:urease accessory protein